MLIVYPAAQGSSNYLLQGVLIRRALAQGILDGLLDLGHNCVEDILILDKTSSLDLRTGRHLALDRVDHHETGDDALGTKDATVLQRRLGEITDASSVHVDEAARNSAHHTGLAIDEVDDSPVKGEDDPLGRNTGG